jgi:fido (protein-threonine AMPylation protein)
LLSEKSFVFYPAQYISIHSQLFKGIYKHAGKIRDYNITKNEWVLEGDTVRYGGALDLKATLDYDFSIEKEFSYKNLSMEEIIKHLAVFVSRLWQIHIFSEGNTRATAVFFIKYIRTLGFDVTNDIFADNAWYFRNALVRANYTNVEKNIYETTKYLELFLNNLIYNENNDLKNRYLHIKFEEKVDIENEKVDIAGKKVDIHSLKLTSKTKKNIEALYNSLLNVDYFGRNEIINVLSISPAGASKLISNLLDLQVIIPVLGHGKGKYCFNLAGVNYE